MYPKKIKKASMNESGTLSTRGTRHSSHKWAPMRDMTKAHWPNAPFTESRTKLGRSWEDRPASPEGGSGLTPIEAVGSHWTGVLIAVLLPLLVACSSCPWQSPASVCPGLAIATTDRRQLQKNGSRYHLCHHPLLNLPSRSRSGDGKGSVYLR